MAVMSKQEGQHKKKRNREVYYLFPAQQIYTLTSGDVSFNALVGRHVGDKILSATEAIRWDHRGAELRCQGHLECPWPHWVQTKPR